MRGTLGSMANNRHNWELKWGVSEDSQRRSPMMAEEGAVVGRHAYLFMI